MAVWIYSVIILDKMSFYVLTSSDTSAARFRVGVSESSIFDVIKYSRYPDTYPVLILPSTRRYGILSRLTAMYSPNDGWINCNLNTLFRNIYQLETTLPEDLVEDVNLDFSLVFDSPSSSPNLRIPLTRSDGMCVVNTKHDPEELSGIAKEIRTKYYGLDLVLVPSQSGTELVTEVVAKVGLLELWPSGVDSTSSKSIRSLKRSRRKSSTSDSKFGIPSSLNKKIRSILSKPEYKTLITPVICDAFKFYYGHELLSQHPTEWYHERVNWATSDQAVKIGWFRTLKTMLDLNYLLRSSYGEHLVLCYHHQHGLSSLTVGVVDAEGSYTIPEFPSLFSEYIPAPVPRLTTESLNLSVTLPEHIIDLVAVFRLC